ncbi:hypothetical protein B0H14DRAFT_3619375 [Mycena olivaceomarginata]|nr:hypothetical protein B0H14DRAFT_3619375 [Mycena olivaceomarginata]
MDFGTDELVNGKQMENDCKITPQKTWSQNLSAIPYGTILHKSAQWNHESAPAGVLDNKDFIVDCDGVDAEENKNFFVYYYDHFTLSATELYKLPHTPALCERRRLLRELLRGAVGQGAHHAGCWRGRHGRAGPHQRWVYTPDASKRAKDAFAWVAYFAQEKAGDSVVGLKKQSHVPFAFSLVCITPLASATTETTSSSGSVQTGGTSKSQPLNQGSHARCAVPEENRFGQLPHTHTLRSSLSAPSPAPGRVDRDRDIQPAYIHPFIQAQARKAPMANFPHRS